MAYHPYDHDKKFGFCDDLGNYHGCCSTGEIKPMAKEIGLGPTMFLITAKKLAWFFLLVSILNIPIYLFLWNSNDTIPITIGDVLAKLSLGGIT